jgi:AAA domain
MTTESDLIDRVASRFELSTDDVERVFIAHGVEPRPVRAEPRSIRLIRLQVVGERTGNVAPGPIDRTFEFSCGVTVISGPNLCGKTSILELVTLMMRGRSNDLQVDVRQWLRRVSLDLLVNGQPIGLRVSFPPGSADLETGMILSGPLEALAMAGASPAEIPPKVTVLASAAAEDDWEAAVASLMLRRLGLEEVLIFTSVGGDDRGRINRHGWAAYFGAIYPPAAANRVVLGTTAASGLAIRLLQVFLDLPAAALRARVHATVQALETDHRILQRRRENAAAGTAARRADAERALADAQTVLAEIDARKPAEDLTALAELSASLSARFVEQRQEAERARSAWEAAKKARISDERTLLNLQETAAARAVFRGLDPVACPRCETSIDDSRRQNELATNSCAVCAHPLPEGDKEEDERLIQEAEDALNASRRAEEVLAGAVEATSRDLETAHAAVDEVDVRLRAALAARTVADRAQAELAVAAARGALDALQVDETVAEEPMALKVLRGTDAELDRDLKDASASIYADLSEQVTALAIRFGITEIDRIVVKGNATMDIYKGGAGSSVFSQQSAGERLRLRYALLVALLRVAHDNTMAGHPGLLLLDSLKAEEVQDQDAQQLLRGLVEIAGEVSALQVIATTAGDQLASTVEGVAATITPLEGTKVLF